MLRKLFLPILLVSAAAAAGCGPGQAQPAPPKPAEVVVSRSFVREVTDYEEFQGKTDAEKAVDVRPHVSGYLHRSHFTHGRAARSGPPRPPRLPAGGRARP